MMEEMIVKPNPRRNTTKRTRAAEVHNMSEKVTTFTYTTI